MRILLISLCCGSILGLFDGHTLAQVPNKALTAPFIGDAVDAAERQFTDLLIEYEGDHPLFDEHGQPTGQRQGSTHQIAFAEPEGWRMRSGVDVPAQPDVRVSFDGNATTYLELKPFEPGQYRAAIYPRRDDRVLNFEADNLHHRIFRFGAYPFSETVRKGDLAVVDPEVVLDGVRTAHLRGTFRGEPDDPIVSTMDVWIAVERGYVPVQWKYRIERPNEPPLAFEQVASNLQQLDNGMWYPATIRSGVPDTPERSTTFRVTNVSVQPLTVDDFRPALPPRTHVSDFVADQRYITGAAPATTQPGAATRPAAQANGVVEHMGRELRAYVAASRQVGVVEKADAAGEAVPAEPITVESDPPLDPSPTSLYDCAATAVYTLAVLRDADPSWPRVVEMLPITERGNSMLEVRQALDQLGLKGTGLRVSVQDLSKLRAEAIVLFETPDGAAVADPDVQPKLGHYIVFQPDEDENVRVLDYPNPPRTVAVTDLAERLRSAGVSDMRLIYLGDAEPLLRGGQQERVAEVQPTATDPADARVVLTEGSRRSSSVLHRFGDAAEGAIVRHGFVVENRTGRPVTISRFQQSCACTSITADPMRIEPGQTSTVTMTASLAERFSTTRVDAVVYFDPADKLPPALLAMQGEAHGRFTSVPPVVDLGEYRPEQGNSKHEVRIEPTGYAGESRISRVVSSGSGMSATLRPDDGSADDAGAVMDVTFDPTKVAGQYAGQVEIYVGDEEKPATTFELRAKVESLIVARPPSVLVSGSSGGTPATGKIVVEHRDGKQVRLLNVDAAADSRELSVAASPDQGPGGLTIDFNVESTRPFSRQVTLQLGIEGSPEPHELIVPVVYTP